MESVVVRFSGTADFGAVSGELAKLQAQFAMLGKEMQAARNTPVLADNAAAYASQLKNIESLRNGYTKTEKVGDQMVRTMVPGFNQLMQASGAFTVTTVKSVSAVDTMTKKIMDQKVKISDAIGNWKQFRTTLSEVAKQQSALQRASAMQWTAPGGKSGIDLYVPNNLTGELTSARTKYGVVLNTLQAMGTATQNWGKNTQWAGRQITAGFTMPLLIASAGLAVLANSADKELTRITKVINTQSSSIADANLRAAATEKELADVRVQAMSTAVLMSKQYGANVTDTLGVEADLAAIGKTGNELMQSTAQVVKVATLGELDYNDAMQMTITLMNTYKMNAKDLGDAFNYMNAIENQTSLTTQDFAAAIPKAASSMASLGVSFQQFGTLLVALKEGGVSADQGANALKSATGKILAPTAQAIAAFKEMNIDINAVAQDSGGNLFNFLTALAPQMAGFSNYMQQGALKALFGTYQFNRLNIVLQNLGQALAGMPTQFSQTAQAIATAGAGIDSWAATADQEIKQFRSSASGQLKIAVASIKAQLTELGAPMLRMLTPAINGISALIKGFSSFASAMPGWVKKGAEWGLTLGAMIGPIMMLVGIAGNWWGSITKMVATIGLWINGTRMQTEEQAAQNALSRIATTNTNSQAQATAILAQRMGDLVAMMNAQIEAQARLNGISTVRMQPRDPATGRFITQAAADQLAAQRAQQEITQQSGRAAANWGKIGMNVAALGVGVGMMSAMAGGSGNISTNIMQASIAALMLGPIVAQGIKGIKSMATAAGRVGEAGVAGVGLMGTAFTKLKAIGTSVFTAISNSAKWLFMTGPGRLLTALVAIGIAFYTINEQMSKASKQQEQLNTSVEGWASILGYTRKQEEVGQDSYAKGITAYSARTGAVKKLTEANQGLVDALGAAADAQDNFNSVYNAAMTEALKVKVDGGSTTQAQMAFDVALQAAGLNQANIKKLDVRFGQVNLDDAAQVGQALNDQVLNAMTANEGKINPSTKESIMNGIKHAFTWDGFKADIGFGDSPDEGAITDSAKAAADKAGNMYWNAVSNALQNGDKSQIKSATKALTGGFDQELQDQFSKIRGDGDNAKLFRDFGITTITQLQTAMVNAAKAKGKGKASVLQKELLSGVSDNNDYQRFQTQWNDALDAVGKAAGLSGKGLANFKKSANDAAGITGFFTAGMSNASNAAAKFGDAAQLAADGASTLEDAMSTVGAIASGSQYADEMKSAYGGAISDYVSQMSEAFSQAQQRAADAIQAGSDKRQAAWKAQQKAQDAAFDAEDKGIQAHYKTLSNNYDAQIKAAQDASQAEQDTINARIDALKKEDDVRQKLFDNEKTRLQRMAEMFSNNVDYNAALNSGNMDEAAKIYSSNQSTVQGWAIDDQQDKLDAQSKAQEDALSAQIDAIQKQTTAYTDSLQKQKDALSDLQQADEDALKARQQAYDDYIQSVEDADQKRTSASITNSNNRYQRDKEAIDQQLAAITAFVPQSVGQVNSQIQQINGAYGAYGGQLTLYGQSWSKIIGDNLELNVMKAANGLQSDIGWGQIGTYIQNQIDAGSNFTLDQAIQFLKTGVWPSYSSMNGVQMWQPSAALTSALKESGAGINTKYSAPGLARASHSGGPAGAGAPGITHSSRVGVPVNAPLFQSEYLTLLRDGEFVVNKQATENNRDILEAINSGQFISRHGGGVVGEAAGAGFLMADIMALAGKQAVNEAASAALMAQSGGGPYTGPLTNSIQGALNFARTQQGKPYIWGGAGPGGQDCSGFMSVVYNYLTGHSPKGNSYPWGRDWVTSSFAGGKEFGPWKRGNGSNHAFRIGVDPGSHMAGTLGGINIESGSGHGPMVGGKALGSSSKFQYQYYLPQADIPQLNTGGLIQYDNTLANLHKDEAVLTKPLTDSLLENGMGNKYNVEVNVNGPINSQIDFEQGVYNALQKLDNKAGRNRTIS